MKFLATQAQDFLNAYEILRESNDVLIIRQAADEGKLPSGTVFGTRPAMGIDVVCLAFSVELHLKDLHYAVSGTAPRGHNIARLFRTLPEPIQKEVVSHHSIAQYGWNDAGIEKELQEISQGFEKWRYAYESTSLRYNSYFALVLIEATRFVASLRRRQ